MSSPGRGKSAGAAIRIAVVAIVAIGLAAYYRLHRKSITEGEVRQIIESHELIGMPLSKAAARLEHRPPSNPSELVVLDFDQVPGWGAGSVVLEVKDGDVRGAYFEREGPPGGRKEK